MAPATAADGHADRIAGLREIARRLRVAPRDGKTLQYVIDQACACTKATSGRLVVGERNFVSGRVLRGGPRIHADLQLDGRVLGSLELTRQDEDESFDVEDESFVELVSDYVARAISGMREGTAMDPAAREFVQAVGEELRSPLSSIAGLLRTALVATDDDETLAVLRAAEMHAARLACMAEDLSVLSRLRSPSPDELEEIEVASWLAEVAAARRAHAEQRGLVLELRVHDERLRIRGSRALLDRAVDHMLHNAIKFTQKGGRIELSAMSFGTTARIAVQDDGVGFDPTDAARVFGRFERSPTAGAEHLAGARHGLAIVHEVMEAHDGKASAQSAVGQGTQVLLTLPVAI